MNISDIFINLPLPLLHNIGYWLILFAAMFEAMPLGFFVPGHTIVIASGFFAKIGVFDIGDVMWVASLGAVLGDLLSYLFGLTYGYALLSRYGKYFFLKEEYLEKTKELMNAHTGKTIIIGRFNLVTRSLAPFIAGASRVPIYRFLFYNIIGGVSWAISAVLIGYLFGQSFELAGRLVGRFIAIAILLSVILILALRYVNKKGYVFTGYHLPILTLNVASLYIFAKLIDDVVNHELIVTIDKWIELSMRAIEAPSVTVFLTVLTNALSPYSLAALSAFILCGLILRKKWFLSLIMAASLTGGFLIEYFLKQVVARPRPYYALVRETDFSFPSAHAAMAVIFFGFLVYAFKDKIKGRGWRLITLAACISACFAVGFSRIYLRAHWLSDVLAGYSLGLFWLTFVIIAFIFMAAFYQPVFRIVKKWAKFVSRKVAEKF